MGYRGSNGPKPEPHEWTDPNRYPRRRHRASESHITTPFNSAPVTTRPRQVSSASSTAKPDLPNRQGRGRGRGNQNRGRGGHHDLPPRPKNSLGNWPFDNKPADNNEVALKNVDAMQLKAAQRPDGATIGFDIVDTNAPPAANVCATLPLPSGGLAFSTTSEQGAAAAYNLVKNDAGSGKVVGVMFAPPRNDPDVTMQDVHWNSLTPPAVKDNKLSEADGGFRLSEIQRFVPSIPSPPEHLRWKSQR